MKNNTKVSLARFNEAMLEEIWEQGFREDKPEWKEWDGPYFDDDYKKYDKFEDFLDSTEYKFYMNEKRRCILFNDKPVGCVSMYWENKKTLWLEIGITIFSPRYWNCGIGSRALSIWIDEIFKNFPKLEHIGLTTWSGNLRMMRAAEKLGMKKEAQIRKVRFWKDTYHDSLSYGILRDEWREFS